MHTKNIANIYLDYFFIATGFVSLIGIFIPSNQAPDVIAPFLGMVFLPYLIWITTFENAKLSKLFFSISILAIMSIYDQEIISTDKFRVIVSLKFILFIASFITLSSLVSIYSLWEKLFKANIGIKDVLNLNMSLISLSSCIFAIIAYNSKDVFYSFGDYYETILYVPFQIASLAYYAISLWIVSTHYDKYLKIIFYLLLLFSLIFLLIIMPCFFIYPKLDITLIKNNGNNYAIFLYGLLNIKRNKLSIICLILSILMCFSGNIGVLANLLMLISIIIYWRRYINNKRVS